MERIITLTTDFGLKDPYQGAMKGAILSVNPAARIIDITHGITPGDVLQGAFVLLGACGYFPEGTVHVGVVDPGVGGDRKPLLIETDRYIFIGPDNGLFSLIAREENIKNAIELNNNTFFRDEVSSTFHGRDIFGPVAAHLSLGASPEEMGSVLKKIRALDLPGTRLMEGGLCGEIIYIDSFGNCITNIRKEEIARFSGTGGEVLIREMSMKGLKKTYSSVEKGAPLALIGSSGFLEVAVNSGAASASLGLKMGDEVVVRAIK